MSSINFAFCNFFIDKCNFLHYYIMCKGVGYLENIFGNNLNKYRTQKGFSQKEVAKHLNIAQSTYSLYENSEREPNIEKIVKIAKLFSVSIDDLFGYKTEKDGVEDLFDKLDQRDKGEIMGIIKQMLKAEKYSK